MIDYLRAFLLSLIKSIMNVIVNACQVIENKKSSEKILEGKVKIKSIQNNNQLILTFEDSGCSVNEMSLQRIF